MNAEIYGKVKQALIDEALRIETAKRPDYTIGNEDVLANFKAVGSRLGLSPEQALAVYALKHEDAITKILLTPHAKTSEPIIGRFADRLNYLSLGFALLVERGVNVGFEL